MRVATIPAGAPFLTSLVTACLDGTLGLTFDRASRDFSHCLIYVPTRRAARALAHAFAARLNPQAVLLPRIVPLGDPADLEEEAIFGEADALSGDGDLPPALGDLGRRLLLTSLVERMRTSAGMAALAGEGDGFSISRGFPDSFALASDLAGLVDEAIIEGADWGLLKDLADAEFDVFWQKTREFLSIASTAWPDVLKDRGVMDAADRRNRLLRLQAKRLADRPPGHPVIAAGSTGTVPATADLLSAIARLPQGAVVLPGLDLALDDKAWDLVADDDGAAGGQPGHPQAALKRLLGRLGVRRADVTELGKPCDKLRARAAIASAAALPANATEEWSGSRDALGGGIDEGLGDVSVIEAADEREEAAAIAVALREVLEKDGKTAALVTPDRALADRVSTELRRWGIAADDSAGQPFSRTPLAGLAELLLQAAREDFRPTAALAVLANPCLTWDGPVPLEEARAVLEIAGLRGVDVGRGLPGLARALADADERRQAKHAHPAARRVTPEALAGAQALLAHFTAAVAPLAETADRPRPLAEMAAVHAAAIEALAGQRAEEGPDGLALAGLMDQLAVEGREAVVSFEDYAAVFAAEAKALVTPPGAPTQGRIRIWGLLEARLMEADRIVLGGLNEGVWPPQPRQDAFLNRAMRQAMGLALPERRIGQSAHDFAQALGAPEVVLARAMTVEGTPMVASRFLRRLDAFVGETAVKTMRKRGAAYLQNARLLDEAAAVPQARRPNPMPTAALQPPKLRVTDVATLFRDPYAIYARDVLGLAPFEPLEPAPGASDRGSIIHEALGAFVVEADQAWPADPLGRLLAIGREAFAALAHLESVAAFWLPAFEKAAPWFVEERSARRAFVARAFVERGGILPLALPDGAVVELSGRGDLVELTRDGTLIVTDFKTGRVPSGEEVRTGLEPQLTLMAAMASGGVLKGVPGKPVSAVRYIKIGAAKPIQEIDYKSADGVSGAVARSVAELTTMLARLRAREIGFLSRRRQRKLRDSGDYDQLARAREWMAGDNDDD